MLREIEEMNLKEQIYGLSDHQTDLYKNSRVATDSAALTSATTTRPAALLPPRGWSSLMNLITSARSFPVHRIEDL